MRSTILAIIAVAASAMNLDVANTSSASNIKRTNNSLAAVSAQTLAQADCPYRRRRTKRRGCRCGRCRGCRARRAAMMRRIRAIRARHAKARAAKKKVALAAASVKVKAEVGKILNKKFAGFNKKFDALAAAIAKVGGKICYGSKVQTKNVGPIWGNHEAARKANAYRARALPSSCKFNGQWWSKRGTSFAQFACKTVQSCTKATKKPIKLISKPKPTPKKPVKKPVTPINNHTSAATKSKGLGCRQKCSAHSECGKNLFCCPGHKICMDRKTKSTAGPNCNIWKKNPAAEGGFKNHVKKPVPVMNPTKPESSSANGLFKTGLPKTVVTPLDKQIWASQNRLRADPAYFIKYLEKEKTCFQPGSFVNRCGPIGLRTQEGVPAIDEAIRALKKQKPLKPMKWEDGLFLAVRDHCRDQGSSNGATGHTGSDDSTPFQRINRYGSWVDTAGENISYGSKTGDSIIMQLFVDDGVASRGHRHNLQKAAFAATGICTGKHNKYRFMCTLIYSGAGYTLNAAGAAKIKQLGGKVV